MPNTKGANVGCGGHVGQDNVDRGRVALWEQKGQLVPGTIPILSAYAMSGGDGSRIPIEAFGVGDNVLMRLNMVCSYPMPLLAGTERGCGGTTGLVLRGYGGTTGLVLREGMVVLLGWY
eukprot:1349392-Rhodomonas_salina.1